MATDDRKAQIGVGVDTTDAKRGFEEVKQGARDMARDVAQSGQTAAKGLDAIGAGGERAAAQADRATRSLASSIQRATAAAQAGSQSTAEYYRALASQRGANTAALEPYLRQLEEVTRRQQQMAASAGVSAAQTAAAMRSIPAQMTDIVTQLAGGANPLLVLTQQGGQLKDMFGGLGPAVRGFGGYLASLINPATAAGAAVLALAVAYEKGASQSAEFARMITLTGNAAGLTEGRFNTLAAKISDTTKTTIGSTRETLQSLAATGQLSGQALEKATAAAQLMSKVTGQAADAIVKQFTGATEAPAKFAAELNKAYNFLTAAELQHIRALEDQGRTQEALTRTFDALNTRLKDAAQNFGTLERWWDTLKRKGSEGIDFVLRIGRVQTTDDMLAGVRSQIAALQQGGPRPGVPFAGRRQSTVDAQIGELRTREAGLAIAADEEAQRADAAAKRAQGEKDVAAAFELQNKHLDKQGQLNKAIRDYATQIKTALESTTITAEQRTALLANYDKNIKAIREQFADKGGASAARSAAKDQRDAELESIKGLERQRVEAAKQAQDEIRVLRATGVLDERQAIAESTRLDVAGLTAKKASLEDQLALMSKRKFSEKEIAQVMREVAEVDAQIKTRMLKGENDLTIAIQAREDAWAKTTQAENASFIEKQQDRAAQIQAEVKAQLEANAAIGKSAVEIASLEAAKLEEAAASKDWVAAQRDVVDWSGQSGDAFRAQAQALRDLAAAKTQGAILQANADTAKKAQEEWERTSDQIGQALANSLMEGGKSAGEYLKGLFRSMVLQPVIKAVLQPIAGAAASILGFSGAANAGGGSSALGAAGNVASLANLSRNIGALPWLSNFSGAVDGLGFQAIANGWTSAGEFLVNNASTITSIGNGLGYLNSVLQITKGNWGAGIGSAVGTWFGGPIGGLIGNTVGGLLDSVFGGGGTPHRGGAFTVSSNNLFAGRLANAANTPGFGLESGAFRSDRSADVDKSVQSLVTGVASTIGSALTAFGLGPATVTGKFASDNDDRSWGGLRIVGRNGRVLANLDTRSLNSNPQKGFEELTQQAGKVVRDALIAADLPGWAKDILRSVSDSASVDVIGQVVTEIKAITDASKTLGPALNLSTSQFIELAKALGGASNTASLAQSYIEAIYTDAEKLKVAQKTLATTFAQLGVAVPANAAAYRRLVESQNLSTDAGRRMYAQLLQLAPVFGEITKAVQQASEGVQAEIERLRGASGVKDVATLQAQFAVKTAQARAGDSAALQALPELSKALEQARTATATSAADVAFVRASLAASLSETLRALKVPGFAAGGWHDGGWRVVGERGPELEYTPPARIYSNPQSQQLLNTARLEQQLAAVTEKLIDCEEKLMAIALHSADTSKQLRRAMPDGDALAVRNAPDTTLAVSVAGTVTTTSA
jgi:phage-related minor tail protein